MADTGMDVSRLVGLIMENPEIIDKIRALASGDVGARSEENEVKTEGAIIKQENNSEAQKESKTSVETVAKLNTGGTDRRNKLLLALKPYVSSKRAGAIDTALGIMDVLSIIKK